MFEKFTQRTRKVIERAQKEALSFNHSHLGTAHLLLGLSGESASVAAGVLRRLGVEYDEAREQVASVEGYGEAGMGNRVRITESSEFRSLFVRGSGGAPAEAKKPPQPDPRFRSASIRFLPLGPYPCSSTRRATLPYSKRTMAASARLSWPGAKKLLYPVSSPQPHQHVPVGLGSLSIGSSLCPLLGFSYSIAVI